MGNILQAIENSAIIEVPSGGMIWRLKKICSADLAKVGHAALAMAQGFNKPNQANGPTESEITSQLANAQPKQLETMATLKDAIVAAGLIAVGDPQTDEWEDVQCVLDTEKSDPKNGTIWVGSLPSGVSDDLFKQIMSLATDGGAALDRLQAFRETARNTVTNRPDSETVRAAAE